MSSVGSPVERVLPEGLEKPGEIPPEIFDAALRVFLAPHRLDMRGLAAQLEIGRATLYRRVSGRDHLLGEIVWWLTRHAIARSVVAAEGLTGADRIVAVVGRLLHDVHAQPALRRFLDAEPEAALRIMTSKHGRVQRGIVDALERLLAEEESAGQLQLSIARDVLAYAIVRIGESFLYADVIADNEPDVDQAVGIIARLVDNG